MLGHKVDCDDWYFAHHVVHVGKNQNYYEIERKSFMISLRIQVQRLH